MALFSKTIDDAKSAGQSLVSEAEQAGEKLAAAAEADLAQLVATLLERAAEYKITFSVSVEKK